MILQNLIDISHKMETSHNLSNICRCYHTDASRRADNLIWCWGKRCLRSRRNKLPRDYMNWNWMCLSLLLT